MFTVWREVLTEVSDMEILMEFMGKGMMLMLAIALPCVLTAAAIGLVVGILQAVTQVQEQTIAAAPKITAVFLVIIIGGTGFTKMLCNLLQEAIYLSCNVVPKNSSYVLDASYHKHIRPFTDEMKADSINQSGKIKQIMDAGGNPPFLTDVEKLKYNAASKMPVPRPNQIEAQKMNKR